MTSSEQHVDDAIEILIGELMADEELRDAIEARWPAAA